MIQSIFHPVTEAVAPTDPRNFRPFIGDGTPYLKVPGLKSVSAVRVGTVEIPLDLEEEVLNDLSELQRTETHKHELIRLEQDADGSPILMRSIKSNDGMWQTGVTVYVAGEWATDKPAAKK